MRSLSKDVVVVTLAVIAGLSVPAAAQTALQLQQQAKKHEGDKAPFPLHANVSLTQSIGSGTFVASPFNPTVSSQLTLSPLLSWQGYTFLLNQSFGMEWTQSDSTTTANQIEMSDTTLGVRYGKLALPDLNLMLLPSLGYQLPVSLASRQAGSLGTLTGGARGIWSLPDQNLSFYGNLSSGYSFLAPALSSRFVNNAPKDFTDDLGNSVTPVTCNLRNPQELFSYGCNDGQLPSVFRWGTGVGGSWSGLDNQLSVSLDLGFGQSFSVFTGPDDELTADNAVPGLVPRQSTSGNLSATYIPVSWFYLTAGLSSFQPFFNADGVTPRFPFWDFVSPYNNLSSFYVDTTFSF